MSDQPAMPLEEVIEKLGGYELCLKELSDRKLGGLTEGESHKLYSILTAALHHLEAGKRANDLPLDLTERAQAELKKIGTQDSFVSGFLCGWMRCAQHESEPPTPPQQA